MHRVGMSRRFCVAALAVTTIAGSLSPIRADESDGSIAERRLELMRARVRSISFRAADSGFPRKLEPKPLFRYDDPTRGYVDGTIWRLGAAGRPLGIITAELHPRYGGRPCVVYDCLSFSPVPFVAASNDFNWRPSGSAIEMKLVPGGPEPAALETSRLFQMKQVAMRFSATQDVEGEFVQLRLLPKPIDRYVPETDDRTTSDASSSIFLFVNGRNPGLMLILECDGTDWQYGVARLSHPSNLALLLDGEVVWERPHATLSSTRPYYATNASAVIPGFESDSE